MSSQLPSCPTVSRPMRKPKQHLSQLRRPPRLPPPLPTVHGCCHGDGQWGRSENGHVPPVPDLPTAGNDHGGSSRVDRQGRVSICASITFFTRAITSFYPGATSGGAVSVFFFFFNNLQSLRNDYEIRIISHLKPFKPPRKFILDSGLSLRVKS